MGQNLIHLKKFIKSGEIKTTLNDAPNLTLGMSLPFNYDFAADDYIDLFGRRFFLDSLPECRKANRTEYTYSLSLCGPESKLKKVRFLNLYKNMADATGQGENTQDELIFTTGEFSLTGKLENHTDLLLSNIKRLYPEGTLECINDHTQSGQSETTPEADDPNGPAYKTLTFSNQNCFETLKKICSEYETKFEIDDDLHIKICKSLGSQREEVFRHGNTNGLYTITRAKSAELYTVLYPYGSTKNVPLDQLPYCPRLTLNNAVADKGTEKMEQNVEKYGRIETIQVWDDIYPEFSDQVVTVDSRLVFTAKDLAVDITAAENRLGDIIVHFNTGGLAGYEFNVEKFDYDNKKFTLIEFADDTGMKLPSLTNAAFQIKPGDEFAVLNVNPDQDRIINARDRLRGKAKEFLDEHSVPRAQYTVELDEVYMRRHPDLIFKAGDTVLIADKELGLEEPTPIRIQNVSRNVLNPFKYSLTLADSIEISKFQKMVADTDVNNFAVAKNMLTDPIRIKKNKRTAYDVSISKQDAISSNNQLDPNMIRPTDNLRFTNNAEFAKKQNLLGPNDKRLDPNFIKDTPGRRLTSDTEMNGKQTVLSTVNKLNTAYINWDNMGADEISKLKAKLGI